MTMPGFVTGQPISGSQIGRAVFQLGPALPHESPFPFVPRVLAQQLWPGGYVPFPAVQQPPVAPPVQPPIQPPANQVIPQPAAQPPRPVAPVVTRSISSGGEPIRANSQRIRIHERPGF